MYLDPDNLQDTGSPKVQVQNLWARMERIVRHLRSHRNDCDARKGLLLVMQKYVGWKRYIGEEYAESYWGV